jgi:DNA-directed RNA polymerase subunit RPC12/RpoP
MNKQKLQELIHKSTREIASELGTSQTNVRYWLKKYDLKTKSKSGPKSVDTEYTCLNCGKAGILSRNSTGKYCDNKCQHNHLYNEYINKWKSGEVSGGTAWIHVSKYVRRYLLLKYECSCMECGWNERHPIDGNPLVEIDHIDGNSENFREDNLRVLCPNCHSKTSTYGSRNKNSARYNKWREVRPINAS